MVIRILTILILLLSLNVCSEEAEKDAKFAAFKTAIDSVKAASLTIYKLKPESRIDDEEDAPAKDKKKNVQTIGAYEFLEEKALNEKQLDEVNKAFAEKSHFAKTGARCFEPGMALHYKSGENSMTLIICLHCRWIHWDQNGNHKAIALSREGVDALTQIYTKYFEIPKK